MKFDSIEPPSTSRVVGRKDLSSNYCEVHLTSAEQRMSTVSILLEGSACAWGSLTKKYDENVIGQLIRTMVSFSNSYLSLSSGNKVLLFMYSHSLKNKLIFNSRRSPSADHSLSITKAMREALESSARSDDISKSSPLATVLSHAICHMKQNEDVLMPTANDQSTATTPTNFTNGRIVIVSMTSDFGPEHSALMNIFFSAAKHGICVDVLSLGEASPLLQQAADITSGLFVQVPHPKYLLKQLMLNVLPEPSARSLFPQPTLESVDYRASCACHHQLVSSGWVCSVCLSVLCAYTPICKACGTLFKAPAIARKPIKRKRKD